jgi:hypothetical protein
VKDRDLQVVEWARSRRNMLHGRRRLGRRCGIGGRALFEQYWSRATFFVTHPGVETAGHERGLHHNFRRDGDTYSQLRTLSGAKPSLSDEAIHAHIVSSTLAFAMPLISGLRPFWKPHSIVEIPTYYTHHFDLLTGATGFEVHSLLLDRPDLKVFDFYPNIIYINGGSNSDYLPTKGFSYDRVRLLDARRHGKGARTLLLELPEAVRRNDLPTATVREVNAHWRTVAKST